MHGPGRITQCGIELVHVGRFVFLPDSDVTGKRQFAEVAVEPRNELRFESGAVEPGSGLCLVGIDGLALHEQPLAGIQRREFEMTRRQRVNFVLDAEQTCDEIVQMAGHRDQEGRFLLRRQRGLSAAQRFQALAQRRIRPAQKIEEGCVYA